MVSTQVLECSPAALCGIHFLQASKISKRLRTVSELADILQFMMPINIHMINNENDRQS